MKKQVLIKSFFFVALPLLFSGCWVSRYVFTDKELTEYYKDKRLKPVYKTMSFSDRSMHYAVISNSDTLPLLLLIHGAPGAWYGYKDFMNDSLLQQNFKMVSVDRLGYGKSGYGEPELSVVSQAQAIEKVMNAENTSGKKIYIIGRSYGAPIAAWLAIHHAEKVQKLLMLSPVIDPDKEKFFWFSKIGRWRVVQWFIPTFLNVATAEKFSHVEQMKLMLPEWEKLNVPTRVVVGDIDEIADTANYSFAIHHIPNANARFMKVHSGHQVIRQQPLLVQKLLLEK